MSHNSTTSYASVKAASRKERCLSASQIAKDPATFETWSAYQNCEEVDLTCDLPAALRVHTDEVFRLAGRLPSAWVNEKKPKMQRNMTRLLTPDFLQFLRAAHESSPELFSADVAHEESKGILADLQSVFAAWQNAERMRGSSRKWSEADFAAAVYELVRRIAARCSEPRAQCTITLSQPSSKHHVTAGVVRALNAKTAKPDGALFIPTRLLSSLCQEEQSPYKLLCRAPKQRSNASAVGGESSFRYQSTLCPKLPDARVFEIASAFWEDKKPSMDELAGAYRQNRMATTAALRQLHALNIRAPVFGVVWAEGCVRAHVDWWQVKRDDVRIYSAPYSGPPSRQTRRTSMAFHEWNLAKPGDIIQVYLFLRNLDRWTVGTFCDAVVSGVTELADRVRANEAPVVAWRRKGDLSRLVGQKPAQPTPPDEPVLPAESSVIPVKRNKAKKRKARRSSDTASHASM